ncbi:MAG: hypothetical protein AAGA70_12280 [Pseudomonadota bacterium]
MTFVEGNLATVALLGTNLDNALITTNNSVALLSGMGGLAAYQDCSKPFRISQRRITLRIDASAQVDLALCAGQAGANTVLNTLDREGNVSHRIEANDDYDKRVLRSLRRCTKEPAPPQPERHTENLISLSAVRNARDRWVTSDSGRHLNDLCIARGRDRLRTLRHVGRSRAWRVDGNVVTSFIECLCERDMQHMRLVPGNGFVLGDLFRGGTLQQLDRILLSTSPSSRFALDIGQVRDCWATRFRTVSHLELYSDDNRVAAVLAPDPHSDIKHWNEMLACLPPAFRAVP